MTARNDARHCRDPPIDADSRLRFHPSGSAYMVVGSLVGFEDDPGGESFSTDGPHRRRQDRRVIPPDSEEDGTRRVWGNDDVVAGVVKVVEGRRKCAIHFLDGLGVDDPRCSPAIGIAITEHLVRAVARSPGGCREGTDDASAVLVFPKDTGRPNRAHRFVFRDDATHRLPVQSGGGRLWENAESGVRRRVSEFGPPLDETFDSVQHPRRFVATSGTRESPNRAVMDFANHGPAADPPSETKADRAVAAGLPRDVRIEPHESRISDEIVVLRQVPHELGREERRAHALEAVCVVDSDPEDHRLPRNARGD